MTSYDTDVLVIGGGPSGASLATRLAKDGQLSVLVIEAENFPRERIGESFASPAVPCLAETGVIDKVLHSGCAIRKYGGFYNWDADGPAVSFFRHVLWQRDGVHRWSLHVARPEFDQVLLDHAASCGATVRQGLSVDTITPHDKAGHTVTLSTGDTLTCRYLADCSGRLNKLGSDNPRAWLSSWRNIAIWTHVRDGQMAQTLPGDWNIFRAPNLSPVGCFAFEDGWVWYIPIPHKTPNGMEVVHSLGLVTDGDGLQKHGKEILTSKGLMALLSEVPKLKTLIADAKPIYKGVKRASNYSMMRDRLCNAEEQWIAVGDAGFFVDPLFSSGVSFAMQQAGAAADLLIRAARDGHPDPVLWDDYSANWRRVAQSFAWGIDQWYAAIADAHPNSVYWNRRAEAGPPGAHLENLNWLLDTDFETDLLHVVTKGNASLQGLSPRGAIGSAAAHLLGCGLPIDAHVRLKPGTRYGDSRTFSTRKTPGSDRSSVWHHAEFWSDPQRHADAVNPLSGKPTDCLRIRPAGVTREASEDDILLFDATPPQLQLLNRLSDTGLNSEEIETGLDPETASLALRLIAGQYLDVKPATAPA